MSPLSLAATAWLWSGLALAVPLVLHLLGRGRGAPRRWPSVALLREAALASGARLRPSQPWLLVLRCALLAAVTLALAEPEMARRGKGGVVWLIEAGAAGGRGGSEVRLLEPGLPLAGRRPAARAGASAPGALAATAAAAPPAAMARRREAPDVWSLLAEADAVLPAGARFEVVARPRLAALRGARPRLGRQVSWHAPAAEAGPAPVAAAGGGPKVRIWVEAAPERADDGAFLRDGLARGAAALGWTVETAAGAQSADLLASLGREAPAGWMARVESGATLLRDGSGLAFCASLVDVASDVLFEQTLCGGEPAGQPVWRDGAGRTVLARQRLASGGAASTGAPGARSAGAVLRFAGRFAPAGGAWGRGAFAALLRAARGGAGGAPLGAAEAETSIEQALPERGAAAASAGSRTALAAPLWLLAGCLFAAERWLAARRGSAPKVGEG